MPEIIPAALEAVSEIKNLHTKEKRIGLRFYDVRDHRKIEIVIDRPEAIWLIKLTQQALQLTNQQLAPSSN
jgi:hypothetical protein